MELQAPLVVRAHGRHHALVVSVNEIAVYFVPIQSGGLSVDRMVRSTFLREYKPVPDYSPVKMAEYLLEFGKLHGMTKGAARYIHATITGEVNMSEAELNGEGQNPAGEPAKKTRGTGKIYKIGRSLAEGEKIAPQAELMLSILREAGDAGVDRATLLDKARKGITSKQPIERVIAFYTPKLVEKGLMTVEKKAA